MPFNKYLKPLLTYYFKLLPIKTPVFETLKAQISSIIQKRRLYLCFGLIIAIFHTVK